MAVSRVRGSIASVVDGRYSWAGESIQSVDRSCRWVCICEPLSFVTPLGGR